MQRRTGATLVEQTVILAVLGVLSALAFRGISALLDDLAVRSAAREVRDVFSSAREHAVASGARTAVQIDPTAAVLTAHAGADTVTTRPVGQLHGVLVQSSRDSMAYSPSGLGYGASNLSIVLVRNASAETVTVSRLGRVR
ncbi:MAG: GspH/FimT family pseudopilin [Phycisphaerae bacterium]|nr:GspH/FimT family pseudopilin [Gemmatimonadaceae bacterium]